MDQEAQRTPSWPKTKRTMPRDMVKLQKDEEKILKAAREK